MSNLNRTNNTNTSTEHTDDPLAELARIVSGETSDNVSHGRSGKLSEPDNDDFSLDMESELLRELEGNSQATTPIKEQSFEDQLLNELDLGDDILAVEKEPEVTESDSPLETQLHADLQAADAALSGKPFIPPSQSNEFKPIETPFVDPNVEDLIQTLAEPIDAAPETALNLDLELPIEPPQEETPSNVEEENNELDDIFAQGFAEELAEEDLMLEQKVPQVEDLGDVFTQSISDIEQSEQIKAAETASDPLVDLVSQSPVNQFEQSPVETFEKAPYGAPNNGVLSEPKIEPQYDIEQQFTPEVDLGSSASQFAPVADNTQNQNDLNASPDNNASDIAFDAAFADPGSLAAEDMEPPVETEGSNNVKRGGGLKLALGALGVALIAGVGIVAWGAFNNGSVSNDENVPVIEAEQSPTKVKPQDPGGKKIANTENKVYENVTGDGNVVTTQDKLINSRQEPTRLEVKSADQKNISRLQPSSQSLTKNSLGGVSPKRVRTLTIKPDGTIVRSAPVKTELASAKPVVTSTPALSQKLVQTKPVVKPATKTATKSVVKAATKRPVVKPVLRPVIRNIPKVAAQRPTASAPTSLTNTRTVTKPAQAASISINKPTNIATNVATKSAAIPAGGYTVQVSSQRSDKAARASYANIRKRFSSVIGNRQPVIQKAVIKGKGTFYRAKIPTRTKAEATKLCASLKRAGGSCFVSR
ncbi:MAG: SPOR domain-containing protein [Rhizobiales bacterium]|nr:SPOR domain-containing protein [Hyphomicrobiales bacterium]